MRVDKQRLIRCLNPRSIAVIGGKEAEQVLNQCQKLRFKGKMWAINPKRESMAGILCIKSIDELLEVPDIVFIGVPTEPTLEIVKSIDEMGAGGAVCLASGFGEVGDQGKQRQQKLIDVAGTMPVFGPNCYGYINTLSGAAIFPDQHGLSRTESGAAIISCSGNIGINFSLQKRGLDIAWLVTVGNQAVMGIEEIIAAALENEKIYTVGIHMEGISNLPLFIELADRARTLGKPLIVLKAGKSAVGASITRSHTATLAGENSLYSALFDRLGIGQVDNIEDFLEAIKLATICGPLSGNKIASLSCSGGEASLIADLSANKNLQFPEILPEHGARLRETLNEYVSISNPMDYHTFIWADKLRMTNTFAAMMSGNYDLTLLIMDFPYINNCIIDDWIIAIEAFIDACEKTNSKGAVMSCMSESISDEIHQLAIANGLTPIHGMQQGISAIEAVSQVGIAWGNNWSLPKIPEYEDLNSDEILGMDEYQTKCFIQDNGVTVPAMRIASTVDQILLEAKNIGYPVVLKAISDDIAHKSELNAVVVGVDNDTRVKTEAARLLNISDKVLIESMVEDAVVELLIGVSYDQLFGHYLILGFGGNLVEIFKDKELLLFPVSREDILIALKKLKTWPLLNGFRGRKPGDINCVVETVMNISNMIVNNRDKIVELEVNPLMVKPNGEGAVAADALMSIRS